MMETRSWYPFSLMPVILRRRLSLAGVWNTKDGGLLPGIGIIYGFWLTVAIRSMSQEFEDQVSGVRREERKDGTRNLNTDT